MFLSYPRLTRIHNDNEDNQDVKELAEKMLMGVLSSIIMQLIVVNCNV